MSSIILNGTFDTSNIQCSKQFVVSIEREALAEFVRQEMAQRNWSTYDVVRESGGLITSNSTVWNVLNLRVKDVTERVLRGFAKAFKKDDAEILSVYYGKPRSDSEAFDSEIFVMFKGFEELSDEDKTELLSTVRMLAAEVQRRRPRKPSTNGAGKKK